MVQRAQGAAAVGSIEDGSGGVWPWQVLVDVSDGVLGREDVGT